MQVDYRSIQSRAVEDVKWIHAVGTKRVSSNPEDFVCNSEFGNFEELWRCDYFGRHKLKQSGLLIGKWAGVFVANSSRSSLLQQSIEESCCICNVSPSSLMRLQSASATYHALRKLHAELIENAVSLMDFLWFMRRLAAHKNSLRWMQGCHIGSRPQTGWNSISASWGNYIYCFFTMTAKLAEHIYQ